MPQPSPQPDTLADVLLDWLARRLAPRLRPLLQAPPRPRSPRVRLISEEGSMLVYKPVLAPPGAADVVKRELELVVDGGEPTVLDVTDPESDASLIRIDQGQTAAIRQRDTDDADNVGDWSESFEFTGADTLSPPPPGAPGVMLVAEE